MNTLYSSVSFRPTAETAGGRRSEFRRVVEREKRSRGRGKKGRRRKGIGDAAGQVLLRLLREAVPGHPRRPQAPPRRRPAPPRPRPLVRRRPPPRLPPHSSSSSSPSLFSLRHLLTLLPPSRRASRRRRRRSSPPPPARRRRHRRLPTLRPYGVYLRFCRSYYICYYSTRMTNISAIDPIFWCFFRGRASLGIHVDTSTRSHLLLIQDQLLLVTVLLVLCFVFKFLSKF